jgi:hypothetical protein
VQLAWRSHLGTHYCGCNLFRPNQRPSLLLLLLLLLLLGMMMVVLRHVVYGCHVSIRVHNRLHVDLW